ncbi:MAG: hypothetical protein NT075_36110 [Chloroflexi bacterium]|nr:hypothetical protein [Chloroflexota bacterium]
MQKQNRTLAFLAYLIPVIGPLLVLLFNRKNGFALYHACQALALTIAAVIVPIAWVICGWIIIWVPLAGAVLAVSLFALVMAAYLTIVISLVLGLINSLRGRTSSVLVFGGWGESLFLRMANSAVAL